MGVWDKLRFLFETDDSSLPEVRLTELTSEGVAAIYAFICSRAEVSDTSFWHKSLDRDESIKAYPNAAQLLATNEAEPFHFLAYSLNLDGVVLPDLGVFVFQDEITLDYRMGPDWDEPRVLALFELMRQLAALDQHARIRLDEHTLPEVEKLFLASWSEYCQAKS